MRMLAIALSFISLFWGTACTAPQAPLSANPETKAKLEAAQYELQLYEEQLEVTKNEISALEEKAGTITKTGGIRKGPSKDLYDKRDHLEEKVIQAKVKVRELETLLK
jgi:hypothetical protein